MAMKYYNTEIGVVNSSGNLNVIYPISSWENIGCDGSTLKTKLSGINKKN